MPIVNQVKPDPQLTIFSTGIYCSHCHLDPGRDPRNIILWDGFRDMDTGQLVCTNCNYLHYHLKWKTDHRGHYSEMPVVVK